MYSSYCTQWPLSDLKCLLYGKESRDNALFCESKTYMACCWFSNQLHVYVGTWSPEYSTKDEVVTSWYKSANLVVWMLVMLRWWRENNCASLDSFSSFSWNSLSEKWQPQLIDLVRTSEWWKLFRFRKLVMISCNRRTHIDSIKRRHDRKNVSLSLSLSLSLSFSLSLSLSLTNNRPRQMY